MYFLGYSNSTSGNLFYTNTPAAKSLQSCLTLYDPIDGSPPGSPIPGILHARTLEWGAIAFSDQYSYKLANINKE